MPATALEPQRGGSLPPRPLSFPERACLAAEILGCYLRVRLALRRGPIETALTALRVTRVPPGPPSAPPLEIPEAQRLGAAVARTLAPLPGDTRCLVRSLVLTRLLAARGVASTLVIGARTAPAFLAHAWVELEGAPLLDPGTGEFARLAEL
jgi:hypothetical protein